ncbi:MAG: hypothetical protein J7M32_13300 [Deltaproteobacteria bacterium]|nr:hypothetical protein [Deltaproteobacteria bacterium]
MGSQVPLYAFKVWGDLFNARQKLALITSAEKVRQAYKEMLDEGMDKDYARAVPAYLGLVLDRTLMFTSALTKWKPDAESPVDLFSRQALPMTWDYSENNAMLTFQDELDNRN